MVCVGGAAEALWCDGDGDDGTMNAKGAKGLAWPPGDTCLHLMPGLARCVYHIVLLAPEVGEGS